MRLLVAAAVWWCLAGDARAQYFGRNKVQYDRDDVRVLATEHFDIYYSSDDAGAALTAGRLAERWHARLSKAFDHALSGRQPLILYGSHRTFEQTNVYGGFIDESTGGFTEARKRRIVLPFASSLAETDHILGHEIVHAFQYDMAAQYRAGLNVPLWFIEGMAEYLTLGPDDPLTAMWMRDAVMSEKLPTIRDLSSPRHFPYRWGAALWAHLVERFGPDLPSKAMRARHDVRRRLEQVTGETLDTLTAGWHESLRRAYAATDGAESGTRPLISSTRGGGRLNLAASLSPDGQRIIFLSERDQFSIDLFLADAATGRIVRKLVTTAASAEFESLQYLHSAGGWDPTGRYFALATVRRGRATLMVLRIDGGGPAREIPVAQLDELYSPTWSPDGSRIAFAGMKGGVSDLFVLDVESGAVRRLTGDQYADLQPAWSPDGRTIAFVTDRFSTDLANLRFGSYGIGLLDLASGDARPGPGFPGGNHVDPAWSPDARSLYFVATEGGAPNVYRSALESGELFRVTDVPTGVSGVTRLSPALSVASRSGALAFSQFRRGGYEIHVISPGPALDGVATASSGGLTAPRAALPEMAETLDPVPQLPRADRQPGEGRRYRPRLSLEAVGSPYFSAGGGPVGGYIQGGASLLFGDLLGDRQLLTAIHVSSRLDESALGAMYVDRSARWRWGVALEQTPDVRFRTMALHADPERERVLTRDRERRIWTHRHLGGFVAYPLTRSQRIEVSAGVRQITFSRERRTESVSALTGRLLEERSTVLESEPSVGSVEAGVALVGDTAVFGATGPILGSRYRFQLTPAIGGLSYTSVLADYRRYLMPVRPYTIAFRVLHSGRYGADAGDARLRDAYLGSSSLVRGYGATDVARSECQGRSLDCPALNTLIASRVIVAKVEVRVPLLSALSSRIRYGPLPVDGFVFADAGAGWGGEQRFGPGGMDGAVVRSVGAGVRVNAVGLLFEAAAVRPLDLRRNGWRFAFSARPGF